jgi:secreted trypsin-like serine protease
MKISSCSILLSIVLFCLHGTKGGKNVALAYNSNGSSGTITGSNRLLSKRIVGGTGASLGEYPSYVYLNGFGGGTLVHGDAVLTSASMKGLFIGQTVLIGGIYEDGKDATESFTVSKEVPHKGYKFPLNNIMIVFLNQSSTAPIQALNFNNSSIPVKNSTVTTIGYGSTLNSTQDVQSLTLQEVSYTVKSCTPYVTDFNRPIRFICVGTTTKKNHVAKGICTGDAGSPLFLSSSSSSQEQVGIANFKKEYDCGMTHDVPDGYTRVSYHARWIQRTICLNTMIRPLPNYCTCALCFPKNDTLCRRQLLCPK